MMFKFLICFSGSQNNLNLCNGSLISSEKHVLVPKKQNNSPNGQKKPTVSNFEGKFIYSTEILSNFYTDNHHKI